MKKYPPIFLEFVRFNRLIPSERMRMDESCLQFFLGCRKTIVLPFVVFLSFPELFFLLFFLPFFTKVCIHMRRWLIRQDASTWRRKYGPFVTSLVYPSHFTSLIKEIFCCWLKTRGTTPVLCFILKGKTSAVKRLQLFLPATRPSLEHE